MQFQVLWLSYDLGILQQLTELGMFVPLLLITKTQDMGIACLPFSLGTSSQS